jgi:hypothetical protein
MDCQDFLAHYSEYLDEVSSPARQLAIQQHLEACARCARYDRVMRQGLALARAVPTIDPSEDFRLRLEHRLMHVRDDMRGESRGLAGGAAVSLALAGLLAVAAFGPLLRWSGNAAESTPSMVTEQSEAPAAERSVHAGMPQGARRDDWWPAMTGVSLIPLVIPGGRDFTTALPGPYSPLIVTHPPVDYPTARRVSVGGVE